MALIRNGALLALIIGLAACGGGAVPSASAPSATPADQQAGETPAPATGGGGDLDLCTLLSVEEVSAVAGVEVADAVSAQLGDGQYSCNYNSADGSAVAGDTYTTTASGVSPADMFNSNTTTEGAEQITGVGDGAVMVGDENFPILFVMHGDSLFAMTVLGDTLDAEQKREATIELARTAVGRLP